LQAKTPAILRLNSISLLQFRNYGHAEFFFHERVVGIHGPNGKGKTNLLDAIYYLCFTKSYFTRSDALNVKHGSSGFRIEGRFSRNEEMLKAVCVLRENGKKEFQVNDQPYERFAQHIGQLPCVMIAPDDVHIITEGSEERRRFTDTILSQLDQQYLQQLIDYNRVLLQRNSYLRALSHPAAHDPFLLDAYDNQLAEHGIYIHQKRNAFFQQLIPLVQGFYTQIAGSGEGLDLEYESQLSAVPLPQLLKELREKDLQVQRTNGGTHKDDILLKLGDRPFKSVASQGQRKSLLFALRLAEFEILKNARGYAPILMLDDVFEKLDAGRMHNLLNWACVQNTGQLLITDTHEDRIRANFDMLGIKYQLVGL
jgi:DNA replication and repair protein RecF